MSKWNGKRFSVYTSEEKTTLGLIKELGEQTNFNTEEVERIEREKTDLYGDHKGTWQGYRPSQVDVAITSILDEHTSQLAELAEKVTYVTPEMYGALGDGITDDTSAIQSALNHDLPQNGYILFSPKTYCVSSVLDISNKNIVFNGCTLKRIADCTVLRFNDSENFTLADVTIMDNGTTYGTAVVGRNCSNVTIKNLSIILTSPHTDTSSGNWATNLSGDRFHIKGLYINTYESGLWSDGLHFTYVTNSTIDDFTIFSGDDCIAITEHEAGGTEFANITSENVVFSNGTIKSKHASTIRLGFDNSGLRTSAEISNIYHKNITFENINSEGKYFLREEILKHGTDIVWTSDSNIVFNNFKYHNTQDVSTYHYFHATAGFSFDGWKFINCEFVVDDSQSTSVGFFQLGSAEKPSGDLSIKNSKFDLHCALFSNCRIDSVIISDSNIIVRNTSGFGTVANDKLEINNCTLENASGTNLNALIEIAGSASRTNRKVIINNTTVYNATYAVSNHPSVAYYLNSIVSNLNSSGYTLGVGNIKYNNLRFLNKTLSTDSDMFLYVPISGSVNLYCGEYVFAKITPYGGTNTDTVEFIYKLSDGVIVGSTDTKTRVNTVLANCHLSLSFDTINKILTVSNSSATSVGNLFIKLYSQRN